MWQMWSNGQKVNVEVVKYFELLGMRYDHTNALTQRV